MSKSCCCYEIVSHNCSNIIDDGLLAVRSYRSQHGALPHQSPHNEFSGVNKNCYYETHLTSHQKIEVDATAAAAATPQSKYFTSFSAAT